MIAFLKLLVRKMLLLNLIFFSLSRTNLSRHVLNSSRKISNDMLEISSSVSLVPFETVLNRTFYSSNSKKFWVTFCKCRTKNSHDHFMMV